MSNLTPILTLNQEAETAVTWTMSQLQARGFQVERTFDLHAARMEHANCPCPHHDTTDCACQMVVLLIHSNGLQPVTVIVHGYDGRTNLSLVDTDNQILETRVIQALIPVMENSET